MPKASNVEVDRRVEWCYDNISKGASSEYILEYASKEWGVTKASVYEYMRRARKKIQERVMKKYPTALQEAVQVLDRIVHLSVFEGITKYNREGEPEQHFDLNAGRNALADKMKLLGFTQDNIEIHLSMIGNKHQDVLELESSDLKKEMKLLEASVVQ